MARPKDPNLEGLWRQRLQRQSTSGLSISAFCALEGVSSTSFQAWKRRLAARSLPAHPEPPLFVPLQLDPDPPQDRLTLLQSRGIDSAVPIGNEAAHDLERLVLQARRSNTTKP